jgi:16S rRNA (guanine527-N7)-methyltransferase
VEEQIEHALGFARAIEAVPWSRALDLGSGGGVPGLVLAVAHPSSTWVLLDGQARRVAFLTEAIDRLALADRVQAVHARAEDAGRDPGLRGQLDLVTARSFGPPAVVAECAAPLLRVRGHLVVSEPPASQGERWPADGLTGLGMRLVRVTSAPAYAVLEQVDPASDRYPRRAGVPARRPLF